MDDNDPPPPPPNPTKKEKRVVLPKKRRSFTRRLQNPSTRSINPEAIDDVPHDEITAEDGDGTPVAGPPRNRATYQGAARKPSSSELTAELKRKHSELSTALSKVEVLARENESLKKRNKSLVETTERAREDLRHQKKQSTVVEKESKKLIRELEERAENAEANAALHYNAQLNKEKVCCSHSNDCFKANMCTDLLHLFLHRREEIDTLMWKRRKPRDRRQSFRNNMLLH
jgi:vacuolar-type H+-ATPase subunit I/STV1